MRAFGTNYAEVRGGACGFPVPGHRKKENLLRDRSWRQVSAKKVLQGAGTQPFQTYMDRIQATVAEWVDLWPIFDICARNTGYEEGRRLQVPWWREEAA